MTFKALDEQGVFNYVLQRTAMQSFFSDKPELQVEEVRDGNLNMVFIVTNSAAPADKVILKQALNYLRVAGESWSLHAIACALRFKPY
ncbi:MAG: hypothetical protein MK132_21285 [Lentisphaerales bacterium]|nr:hypothetical protein [Lentisphaerales bacterium]